MKIDLAKHISWQIVPDHSFAYVFNIVDKKYYVFRNTELFIWELVAESGGIDANAILTEVSKYYELEEKDVKDDITEFINSLYETGVISIDGIDRYKKVL